MLLAILGFLYRWGYNTMQEQQGTTVLRCFLALTAVVLCHLALQRTAAAQSGAANIISPRLCFTLQIPGQWIPGNDPGTYYSPDRKQFVEVLNLLAKDLDRGKGITLVEKEGFILEQAYQKALRKKLTDVQMLPFESAMEGTWKWNAARPEGRGTEFHFPKRFIVDLSPEGIIVLNIQGTPDDDDLARRIIGTIRQSKQRPCKLPNSVDEILKDAGITKKPNPAESNEDRPTKVPAPLRVYRNPAFPWSIGYPEGWKLGANDAGQVQFTRATSGDEAACSVFAVPVQFHTVDDFANFWLTQSARHMEGQGIRVRRTGRTHILLAQDITGVSVLTEISDKGKSRSVFVLANGVGYTIDCETSWRSWDLLAPLFEQILTSFNVEVKP